MLKNSEHVETTNLEQFLCSNFKASKTSVIKGHI